MRATPHRQRMTNCILLRCRVSGDNGVDVTKYNSRSKPHAMFVEKADSSSTSVVDNTDSCMVQLYSTTRAVTAHRFGQTALRLATPARMCSTRERRCRSNWLSSTRQDGNRQHSQLFVMQLRHVDSIHRCSQTQPIQFVRTVHR